MRWLRSGRWSLVLLALLSLGNTPIATVGGSGRPSPMAGNALAGPTLIESDDQHIVLEWTAPPYQVSAAEIEGQAFQRLSIPSCPPAGRPGDPELPVCTALLGIPPDVPFSLRILEVESLSLPGKWLLPPLPEPAIEEKVPWTGPESIRVVGERYSPGPAYRSDAPFPPQPAALGEPAFLRHQRLVAISFSPFQYDPRSGRLLYFPRLRLEIAFGESHEAMGEVAEPPEFERLLAHTLLNYAQARHFRRTVSVPLDLPPAPPNPGWRIPVLQEGVYRLTYPRLQEAGLPVENLDPRTLRLFRYGQEVAIRVLGEEDGRFDPQDAVLFYGRPLYDNRYTDAEVYWLTYGGEPGRRMAKRDGTPGGGTIPTSFTTVEHLEENHNYYSIMPWRPDHDHWFWNYTYPEGGIFAQTYSFPAHPLAGETYTATLRVHLHGGNRDDYVNPDHHIRVFLNDTFLGDLWWDGRVELTPTWAFSSTLFQPSGNTVRIEAPGDTGAVADWVVYDWLELEERRLFAAEGDRISWEGPAGTWEYHLTGFSQPDIFLLDVTETDAPVEIVSATVIPVGSTYSLHFTDAATRTTRYLAVSDGQVLEPASIEPADPVNLRDPANGADYIIITHGDFYTQAQTLASFRAGQGLRARAVDVQDVYDLFAYGRRTPEALHDFLAYAYENWLPPAPSYVVLIGDGHFDPKDHRGYGLSEYILPYLAFVDPWMGETAADNRYVCLSGEDLLPDMHLGRLPANTSAEARAMVNKVIAYEGSPPSGDWRTRGLFAADNADQAGNFPGLSDALLAGFYPPPYQAQRVYLGVTCIYENPSVECRNQILSAVNEGRLLINYIGHGGIWLWANERLLDNFALPQLANAPYLPVVLAMTCYEGMYHWTFLNPNYYSLAETFLRAEGKGWAASWSPTGLGVATGHHYLNEGFFQAVFLDDERRLGPAALAGKLRLWQSGAWRDLLDTYLLLGDPALEMPLLETDLALEKTTYPQVPLYSGDSIFPLHQRSTIHAQRSTINLHPGDPLTFTLRLSAAGPATAHHVVLTDTLSPWIVSPTVWTTGITLTQRPDTRYVWDVEDLGAGQTGLVTVTARLSWQTPAGLLLNQARVATTAKETDVQNNVDTATWLVIPGPPYRISVTATPPALPADGASLSLIRAMVVDTAGNPVADGTPVAFATDAGTFLDGSTYYTTTTAQGAAEVFLRAASQVVTATVTVTSGQAIGQVQVPFVSTAPHTILVEAFPTAIPVTGTAQITATVLDVLGHPVRDGTAVTFTTSLGTLTPTVTATVAGIAGSTLYGEGLSGLATILARSGSAAGTATVRIGSGSSFTLTLVADPPAIPADGQSQSTITATLVRADGQPITLTYWISFSTTLGSIPSRSLAVSGTTTVFLTAGTTAGNAVIVAAAQRASASTRVQLLPGEAAVLTLTAEPAEVPVGGRQSTLLAVVRDAYGNAVADGTPVTLSTTLGTVSPTLASTWNGRAYSWLTSGSQAGIATVLAHSGPAGDTAAVRFTALDPATLTLSADPPVVVADGVFSSTLSAWVADPFGNPVEDGTTVQFLTSLGHIRPSQAGTVAGWATAVLTATQVGTATVRALSGGIEARTTVSLVPGAPAHILVAASPSSLCANGVSTATVTTYLWDALSHPVADGTPVTFAASLGTITPTLTWTKDGRAQATLHSSTLLGDSVVQAQSGMAAGTTSVAFIPGPPYAVTVTAEPVLLVANGTSTATVNAWMMDAWGHAVADGTPVTFTTSLGTITPTLTWTQSGRAQAILRSGWEEGWALVRVSSASAGGETWVRFFLYHIYLPLVGRSWAGLSAR